MTLAEIVERLREARGGRRLQPPASTAAIDAFTAALRDTYGFDAPATLRELYVIADGIDYDGLQVFATTPAPFASKPNRKINGVIEMNDAYGDFGGLEGRLIIANDNGPLIWGIDTTGEIAIVTSTGDRVATYPSLAAALEAVLLPRLR
jgi:hypothetical protein